MNFWKLQVKLDAYSSPSHKTKGIYPFYWMAVIHMYAYHLRHPRRLMRIV